MRVVVIVAMLFQTAIMNAQTLRVGILQFPPHSSFDSNQQPSGSLVDAIDHALSSAKLKYRIRLYPPKRLFLRLSEGVVDVYIGLKFNPKYHDSVIYSKMSVGAIEQMVYTLGNKNLPASLTQLLAKKVGLIRGFGYNGGHKILSAENNKMYISYSNTHKSGLAMLQAKRIDYLLDYKGPINILLAQKPVEDLRSRSLVVLDLFVIIPKVVPDARKLMSIIENHYPRLP